jgi:hypothetical protein
VRDTPKRYAQATVKGPEGGRLEPLAEFFRNRDDGNNDSGDEEGRLLTMPLARNCDKKDMIEMCANIFIFLPWPHVNGSRSSGTG